MSRHAERLRMTDTRILVVEDEQPIRDLIAFGLRHAGCEVALAEHSQAALASISDRRPDVVMQTARAAEADKVAGLQTGADDYPTKPFSARERIARIHAVLRRSSPAGA
jgi:two-component system phosphate regulon response regulator PhoB